MFYLLIFIVKMASVLSLCLDLVVLPQLLVLGKEEICVELCLLNQSLYRYFGCAVRWWFERFHLLHDRLLEVVLLPGDDHILAFAPWFPLLLHI